MMRDPEHPIPMTKLGVNIDHIATLRQQRLEFDPDPVKAARICEQAGADSIVSHLREDRRHIQDKDVRRLRAILRTRWNLEMSMNPEIVDLALKLKPDTATLVPERRRELTTEGGLDTIKFFSKITAVVKRLRDRKIEVSLFIDPVKRQIDHARDTGARMIELHTGRYANSRTSRGQKTELLKLQDMAQYAQGLGLRVSAGHGLKYDNVKALARIKSVEELNIGHSIISRAVFVGLRQAVQDMKALMSL